MLEELQETGEATSHTTETAGLYRWAGEARPDGLRDAVALDNEWHGITLNVNQVDIIDGVITTKEPA